MPGREPSTAQSTPGQHIFTTGDQCLWAAQEEDHKIRSRHGQFSKPMILSMSSVRPKSVPCPVDLFGFLRCEVSSSAISQKPTLKNSCRTLSGYDTAAFPSGGPAVAACSAKRMHIPPGFKTRSTCCSLLHYLSSCIQYATAST